MKTFAFLAMMLAAAVTAAPQGARAKRTADNDPDLKEMRDYRLSMDKIQKYVAAYKAVVKDPTATCLKDNSPGDAKTLAEGEKRIASCGRAGADIESAGLKPREFLVLTGALIGDVMLVGMKKQGQIKEYPPAISPENAAFVEQNYDKIQAVLAPMTGDAK